MKFEITRQIVDLEASRLRGNLAKLFPGCSIVCGDGENVCDYQIVRLEDFGNSKSKRPQLTILAINQLMENRNTFKPNELRAQFGLKNCFLRNMTISFSGYNSPERKILKLVSQQMGAKISSFLNSSVSCLISNATQTKRYSFAFSHQIPIYSSQWIDELFLSSKYINPDSFRLLPLNKMVFSFTHYSNNVYQQSKEIIEQNGGKATRALVSKSHIIIPDGINTLKARISTELDIPITTINSITEALENNSAVEMIQPPVLCSAIFDGMDFKIDESLNCFNHHIRILVQANSGHIIDGKDANFLIIHRCRGAIPHNARTIIWLQRCVEEGRILSIKEFPLYSPTSNMDTIDFSDMIVSITGFSHKKYLDVVSSLKWLGIQFSRQLYKSCTCLITNKPNEDTKKTIQAKKWGIPIYPPEWIENIWNGTVMCLPIIEKCNEESQEDIPEIIIPKQEVKLVQDETTPVFGSSPYIKSQEKSSQGHNYLDDDDEFDVLELDPETASSKAALTPSGEIIRHSPIRDNKFSKSERSQIESLPDIHKVNEEKLEPRSQKISHTQNKYDSYLDDDLDDEDIVEIIEKSPLPPIINQKANEIVSKPIIEPISGGYLSDDDDFSEIPTDLQNELSQSQPIVEEKPVQSKPTVTFVQLPPQAAPPVADFTQLINSIRNSKPLKKSKDDAITEDSRFGELETFTQLPAGSDSENESEKYEVDYQINVPKTKNTNSKSKNHAKDPFLDLLAEPDSNL